MSKRYRRYEMLLPLKFNDGPPVPEELHLLTLSELRDRFGADSIETQTIRGEWMHEGIVYRDDMVRVWIDTPDTVAVERFFKRYKRELMNRYRQLDIWMVSFSARLT
jgi:hypothetical protein